MEKWPHSTTVAAYLDFMEGKPGGSALAAVSYPMYLKDWHFVLQSGRQDLYTVPDLFCSDWLNDFCLNEQLTDNQREHDYRFVYLGPKVRS